MTSDPRWTTETRDAVARRLFNLDRPSGTDWWATARHAEAVDVGVAKVRASAVLAVLADAGLLVDPAADRGYEWAVEWGKPGGRIGVDRFRSYAADEAEARTWAVETAEGELARRLVIHGPWGPVAEPQP